MPKQKENYNTSSQNNSENKINFTNPYGHPTVEYFYFYIYIYIFYKRPVILCKTFNLFTPLERMRVQLEVEELIRTSWCFPPEVRLHSVFFFVFVAVLFVKFND